MTTNGYKSARLSCQWPTKSSCRHPRTTGHESSTSTGGTLTELKEHRHRQRTDRTEWGADYSDNDLVFCKENGDPLHPQTFTQAFDRLVAKMDLPRIRLHDLRHTHATIALGAGIPPKVISERLGHENPAFTLKQYAHVVPGMQAEAAATIAELVATASQR